MTVTVRTPLGRYTHLARSRDSRFTLCGVTFLDTSGAGVKRHEPHDLVDDPAAGEADCRTCLSHEARWLRRQAGLETLRR